MSHAVTLDVGGSHVTAALVDLSGRRVTRLARRDIGHQGTQDEIVGSWAEAALEVVGTFGGPLSHVGIAVPSPFNHEQGQSQMTHKFRSLLNVPLRPALAKLWPHTPLAGLPVRFGNDADLFALGEWWAGAGRGADRLIGLTLGTGLGSGFIAAGKIVTAGQGVPPGGELWNVPFRNAPSEDAACGAALSRAWATRTAEGQAEDGQTGKPVSAHELSRLAEGGNPAAASVFADFGATLAALLAPWVQRFGAERVVLGGNVSRASALFAPSMQAGLDGCEVRVSEQFEAASLLGAAAL